MEDITWRRMRVPIKEVFVWRIVILVLIQRGPTMKEGKLSPSIVD